MGDGALMTDVVHRNGVRESRIRQKQRKERDEEGEVEMPYTHGVCLPANENGCRGTTVQFFCREELKTWGRDPAASWQPDGRQSGQLTPVTKGMVPVDQQRLEWPERGVTQVI